MRSTRARALTLAAAATVAMTMPCTAQAASYVPPTPADLSNLSWTDAFDALVVKMSREYAFTDWKQVDWKRLAATYRPRIAQAQADGDGVTYLLALREFTHELHDGHVSIRSETGEFELGVRAQRAGGGFGLIVDQVDKGDIAAVWVQRDGPAWRAGIRKGAVITSWQGRPVRKQLRRTSTALAPSMPTRARMKYERLRFLVRASVGDERTVGFEDPEGTSRHVTLTAVDDGLQTLEMTDASSILHKGWPKDMVTTRLLRGNIGYVQVAAELDLPSELPGDHTPTLTQFRSAIRAFQRRDVNGLVIDIRGNSGGMDQMVADMMSSFSTRTAFYEYQNWINARTGRFEIWKTDDTTGAFTKRDAGLWIHPGPKPYAGPIAVLIDNGCVSSGEGLAMGLSRLPNATLIGFYGTNGSFGMVGDGVLMPGGQEIGWPFGQSLDKSRTVQIDSRHLVGGVPPDVVVPRTVSTINRTLRGDDVLLHRALRALRG